MIACVCGNVSDKKVRIAIESGATTLEELQLDLGVCCGCCCCQEFLEGMLKDSTST